jgi:hypothetical protein
VPPAHARDCTSDGPGGQLACFRVSVPAGQRASLDVVAGAALAGRHTSVVRTDASRSCLSALPRAAVAAALRPAPASAHADISRTCASRSLRAPQPAHPPPPRGQGSAQAPGGYSPHFGARIGAEQFRENRGTIDARIGARGLETAQRAPAGAPFAPSWTAALPSPFVVGFDVGMRRSRTGAAGVTVRGTSSSRDRDRHRRDGCARAPRGGPAPCSPTSTASSATAPTTAATQSARRRGAASRRFRIASMRPSNCFLWAMASAPRACDGREHRDDLEQVLRVVARARAEEKRQVVAGTLTLGTQCRAALRPADGPVQRARQGPAMPDEIAAPHVAEFVDEDRACVGRRSTRRSRRAADADVRKAAAKGISRPRSGAVAAPPRGEPVGDLIEGRLPRRVTRGCRRDG